VGGGDGFVCRVDPKKSEKFLNGGLVHESIPPDAVQVRIRPVDQPVSRDCRRS
jgi:hypothetical protein